MEHYMINPFISRLFLVFNVWIGCLKTGSSQVITGPVGAEQWMLGGNSTTVHNVWSANNNAAGITHIRSFQTGLYAEQRFTETHLQTTNLSIVAPLKYLHIAGAINYFGYTAFNQQRLSVAVAKKLSAVFALGVQLNYVTTFIHDYGNTGTPALGLGMTVKPLPKLSLACVVFNPSQAYYGKSIDRLPAYIRLGAACFLSDKIRFHLEADQQLSASLIWRMGMYYQIHEVLHLALGASTHPAYYTCGTALILKKMKLDLAVSVHEILGLTPHIGLSVPVSK